jgi:hypothetical protein
LHSAHQQMFFAISDYVHAYKFAMNQQIPIGDMGICHGQKTGAFEILDDGLMPKQRALENAKAEGLFRSMTLINLQSDRSQIKGLKGIIAIFKQNSRKKLIVLNYEIFGDNF